MRTNNIGNIFLLNDDIGASIFNEHFNTDKFKKLVDPIKVPKSKIAQKTGENPNLNFLFIGEVSERKGINCLIETLKILPTAILPDISFTIAGNCPHNKHKINQEIESIRKTFPSLFKKVILERISDEKFHKLLHSSDVVLCLHQQLEGSSGIVGKAAAFNKPIIGPENGLIGQLVKEYNLGLQTNTAIPANISKAITTFHSRNFDSSKALFAKYVENHSTETFTKTLLQYNV
ncbi:hypothetical protein GCM10008086_09750 [Salegentibacter mishustinae]|nr:hypothetical protein GCM10008086_09750 [Salegentibacter mishustinae]